MRRAHELGASVGGVRVDDGVDELRPLWRLDVEREPLGAHHLLERPPTEPPLRCDDGSTASTASRWRREASSRPSDSMSVDLPVPGGPEMPSRRQRDASRCGRTSESSSSAASRLAGCVDSTSVIALLSARRSPASAVASF